MNLLTTTQAASLLGVKLRAVQAMVSRGLLPAQRIGRDLLIRPQDVEKARNRPGRGRPRKEVK